MLESPCIYADVLFIINFFMDYLLLWATGRFARVKTFFWRLFLASVFGSLYGVLILFPGCYFLQSALSKFLASLVMVGLVFLPLSWKKFFQVFMYFYLVSFAMGGAMLGLMNLLGDFPAWAFNCLTIPYLWLLAAVVTAIVLGKWGVGFLQKSLLYGLLSIPVKIKIQGQEVALEGLVDTGNQLVDPLTGNPVIIVEYRAVASLLPEGLQNIFTEKGDLSFEKLAIELSEQEKPFFLRLIPFTTIGKHHGMMVGFKPDEVSIKTGDRVLKTSSVVVGIYQRPLSPKGNYRALLHPDLLHTSLA